jgi:hypothetical protein
MSSEKRGTYRRELVFNELLVRNLVNLSVEHWNQLFGAENVGLELEV